MCCSPFVTQSVAADDVLSGWFEGGACRPVGLTAREEGTSPTGLAGCQTTQLVKRRRLPKRLRARGSSLVGPHECTVARSKQKFRIDQRAQQCIASGPIKSPQPLRLGRRQPQSGHLDVFALNASQYVLKRLLCWHHGGSPVSPKWVMDGDERATRMPRAHAVARMGRRPRNPLKSNVFAHEAASKPFCACLLARCEPV